MCWFSCHAGQLVAIPGSTDNHMYILTRGYADVYMNSLLIDTLVPGDSFCEAVSTAATVPACGSEQAQPQFRATMYCVTAYNHAHVHAVITYVMACLDTALRLRGLFGIQEQQCRSVPPCAGGRATCRPPTVQLVQTWECMGTALAWSCHLCAAVGDAFCATTEPQSQAASTTGARTALACCCATRAPRSHSQQAAFPPVCPSPASCPPCAGAAASPTNPGAAPEAACPVVRWPQLQHLLLAHPVCCQGAEQLQPHGSQQAQVYRAATGVPVGENRCCCCGYY